MAFAATVAGGIRSPSAVSPAATAPAATTLADDDGSEKPDPVATPSPPSYFKESFEESRSQLLQNLVGWPPTTEHESIPLADENDPNLFIDSIFIPSTSGKKDRLLIVTSGVHGIEGFVGSALQSAMLRENFWGERDEDLNVLIVHAVNPYGFKHERRVSAANVDLNRNFDTTKELFKVKNEGYAKIRELFNPTEPATTGFFHRLGFYFKAVYAIYQHSMAVLRAAILSGQYEFADSIFFGGKDFEPQKAILEGILTKYALGYAHVLMIDLHTGYGARGQLHLFADKTPEMDGPYIEKIFAGQKLDYGQQKDFYQVTGSMVSYAAKFFTGKARFAPMVFEFGTLDSQKTLGSIDSLYRMTLENQLAHHQANSPEDAKQIRDLFREMFYPSSVEWRQSALKQFKTSLSLALQKQRAAAAAAVE